MATATAEKPKTETPRRTRSQVAEALAEILGEEPRSAASLAREIGYSESSARSNNMVANALAVLVARGRAKRIPDVRGKRGGWVSAESSYEAELVAPVEIDFDYDFEKKVPLSEMFVDDSYQRPLTTFWKKIVKDFDPYLFQPFMLSDRGPDHPGGRYALIDGQTRWAGGTQIGIPHAGAQIFRNLSPEDEADIFWRIQKYRHGTVSWHTFRAKLRSNDSEAHKIKTLVETTTDWRLGEGPGDLRAMSALEQTFRQDPFTLERALADFWSAWGEEHTPEGSHIKGLHFFFRHFPLESKNSPSKGVNDERLVRRLKVTGPDGLNRKASAAKELGGKGTAARWMAMAIQGTYLSGGGSR